MTTHEPTTPASTSMTRGRVGVVVSGIGRGLRTFALVEGLFILLLGGVLVAAVFRITAESSTLRSVLASVAAVVICAVVGIKAAAACAIARTLVQMLQQAAVGEKVVHLLVEPLLSHGSDRLKVSQVRETVTGRGPAVAAYLAEGVPRPVRWLTRLLGRMLAHVTLRHLLRHCRTADGRIDPVKVRQVLGSSLDELLIQQVRSAACKVAVLMALAAATLSLLAAWLLSILPGAW